jgi:hypothetical protein
MGHRSGPTNAKRAFGVSIQQLIRQLSSKEIIKIQTSQDETAYATIKALAIDTSPK